MSSIADISCFFVQNALPSQNLEEDPTEKDFESSSENNSDCSLNWNLVKTKIQDLIACFQDAFFIERYAFGLSSVALCFHLMDFVSDIALSIDYLRRHQYLYAGLTITIVALSLIWCTVRSWFMALVNSRHKIFVKILLILQLGPSLL